MGGQQPGAASYFNIKAALFQGSEELSRQQLQQAQQLQQQQQALQTGLQQEQGQAPSAWQAALSTSPPSRPSQPQRQQTPPQLPQQWQQQLQQQVSPQRASLDVHGSAAATASAAVASAGATAPGNTSNSWAYSGASAPVAVLQTSWRQPFGMLDAAVDAATGRLLGGMAAGMAAGEGGSSALGATAASGRHGSGGGVPDRLHGVDWGQGAGVAAGGAGAAAGRKLKLELLHEDDVSDTRVLGCEWCRGWRATIKKLDSTVLGIFYSWSLCCSSSYSWEAGRWSRLKSVTRNHTFYLNCQLQQ